MLRVTGTLLPIDQHVARHPHLPLLAAHGHHGERRSPGRRSHGTKSQVRLRTYLPNSRPRIDENSDWVSLWSKPAVFCLPTEQATFARSPVHLALNLSKSPRRCSSSVLDNKPSQRDQTP